MLLQWTQGLSRLVRSCVLRSVPGAAVQEEVVWANVRDMAIQHWMFEKEEQNQEDGAVMLPHLVKRARTGMGSMLSI